MSTWRITAVIAPRSNRSVGMIRSMDVHSDDLSEADDVVGEAEAAASMRWPGFQLLRTLRCELLERGEIIPRSRPA